MEKILFVATVPSMIGQFNMDNIDILLKKGCQIDIACNFENTSVWSTEKISNFKKQLLARNIGCMQIDFGRKPKEVQKHVRAYSQLRKIINKNKYSIIHCHTPVAAAITRLVAAKYRKTGLKVIYTAHGFHFYSGANLISWCLIFPIEWIFSWVTDVLITINEEDYERAREKLHAKKIEYIHGVGVNVSKFERVLDYCGMDKKTELNLEETDKLLLSVGELSGDKNHQIVIKALSKINNEKIHYAIAGCGTTERELRKLSIELGVEKQVHLLGFREDIRELLWSADVFVFPSISEGLPVALMEAMAAKIPIICSSCRGNVDLIKDKRYLFDWNSCDQLIQDLEFAFGTDNSRYVDENSNRLKLFGLYNVSNEMKRIYNKVLNLKGEEK